MLHLKSKGASYRKSSVLHLTHMLSVGHKWHRTSSWELVLKGTKKWCQEMANMSKTRHKAYPEGDKIMTRDGKHVVKGKAQCLSRGGPNDDKRWQTCQGSDTKSILRGIIWWQEMANMSRARHKVYPEGDKMMTGRGKVSTRKSRISTTWPKSDKRSNLGQVFRLGTRKRFSLFLRQKGSIPAVFVSVFDRVCVWLSSEATHSW